MLLALGGVVKNSQHDIRFDTRSDAVGAEYREDFLCVLYNICQDFTLA